MTADEQLDYWQRRHEADPGSRAFAPLAELHLAAGRVERALALLQAGLARHPAFLAAWLIEARCRLRAGEADAARRALGEALRLDPDNLAALRLLAELAAAAGNLEELGALLRRIVRLDPADDAARGRLAACHAGGERPADAGAPAAGGSPAAREPLAQAVPAEAPAAPARRPAPVAEDGGADPAPRAPQATATLTLARIYRSQGHRQKALEVLRQVQALHPERPEVRAEIAAVERELAAAADNAPAGAPEPGAPVQGRQESRPHFEAWVARLAEPGREDRPPAGPGRA